jgi:two-component system cell cycle response regulator DivK
MLVNTMLRRNICITHENVEERKIGGTLPTSLNLRHVMHKRKCMGAIISKILIIEDNPQNALLMRRVLEARNHQVVHASEGETGLKMAMEEAPDLILVDLGLPDIDGQTLVSFIKRVPELMNVPAIAVTAWPEDTAREMAKAYGCDGFISKPINTRAFPDQIAAYLAKD